jgi:hypothetical protein
MIYLHSTVERQREIADALGALAEGDLKPRTKLTRGASGNQSGTQRARRRKNAS